MKNKIIINIVIVYFILLVIVLIYQLPKNDIAPNQTISNDLNVEDKLKNATILYVDSPIAIVNERQTIIDKDDLNITPVIFGGRTYIPVAFLGEAFGASIDWNKQNKETTVRYNNKAIIFKNDSKKIRIVDSSSDTEDEIDSESKIFNNRAYIPVRIVAEIFTKEVYTEKNLIILSNIKDIFDSAEEMDIIDGIIEQVKGLPIVGNDKKLMELLDKNKNAIASFMLKIKPSISIDGETNPNDIPPNDSEAIGIKSSDIIKNDGEYIYSTNGKTLNIVKALPVNNMARVSSIQLEEKFSVKEIYIHNSQLIILGNMLNSSKIYIYNIEDKNNISLLREISVDGNYVSSSIISGYLYSISSCDAYSLYENKKFAPPSYTDSNEPEGEKFYLSFNEIPYFPDMTESNYMNVAGINLNDASLVKVSSFFGNTNNVYLADSNIYVANNFSQGTNIYKLQLKEGSCVYSKRVSVEGDVKKPEAMNEYENHLRIITLAKENANLFILDEELNVLGNLTELDKDVDIESVNFLEDFAYINSDKDKKVYLMELSNPKDPKIKGAIELPFDILEPYGGGESYIIGIEQIKENEKDAVKLSLLDISDFNNPKVLFNTVQENSVAFDFVFYDESKGILALPVELKEKTEDGFIQGIYCYQISLDNGFELKSKISHLNESEEKSLNKYIKQIIYIGDNLYFISNDKISAIKFGSYSKLGEINLKEGDIE